KNIKHKKTALRSLLVSGLSVLLMLSLTAFLFYQAGRSIYLTSSKLIILDNAKTEVGKLRLANLKLILENSRVLTEDYIQTESRDRLNYSNEGDVLFVIPDELINNDNLDQYVASFLPGYSGQETSELEVVAIWIQFLTKGI